MSLHTLFISRDNLEVHRVKNLSDLEMLTKHFDFDCFIKNEEEIKSFNTGEELYLFATNNGFVFGVRPVENEFLGVFFDDLGAPVVIEEYIENIEKIDWEGNENLLTLLCQIDPKLPFDIEHPQHQPYCVALNQYPGVIFEDRSIPDDMLELITNDKSLTREALNFINEHS